MGIMDTKKELTQIAKVRIGLCCVSFLSAIAAFVECKGTILPLQFARYIITFNFSVFMIQFTFLPAFFTNENFVVPQPVDPKLQMIMRLFGSFGLITLGMTQFIELDIYMKWAGDGQRGPRLHGPDLRRAGLRVHAQAHRAADRVRRRHLRHPRDHPVSARVPESVTRSRGLCPVLCVFHFDSAKAPAPYSPSPLPLHLRTG